MKKVGNVYFSLFFCINSKKSRKFALLIEIVIECRILFK